jgi:uncharacterized protein YgfB (UPF0149 family)
MTYQVVDAIIGKIESTVTAAEAHGMATGMLCIDEKTEAMTWLNEMFQDIAELLEEDKQLLVSLFEQTQELVSGDEFAFDLLLPDDDADVELRIDALRNWSKGFLLGVGYSTPETQWPGETREILKDIVEFSKMDIEGDEDDEEIENALMEIQEYLRAAIMLFKAEFNMIDDEKVLH